MGVPAFQKFKLIHYPPRRSTPRVARPHTAAIDPPRAGVNLSPDSLFTWTLVHEPDRSPAGSIYAALSTDGHASAAAAAACAIPVPLRAQSITVIAAPGLRKATA